MIMKVMVMIVIAEMIGMSVIIAMKAITVLVVITRVKNNDSHDSKNSNGHECSVLGACSPFSGWKSNYLVSCMVRVSCAHHADAW